MGYPPFVHGSGKQSKEEKLRDVLPLSLQALSKRELALALRELRLPIGEKAGQAIVVDGMPGRVVRVLSDVKLLEAVVDRPAQRGGGTVNLLAEATGKDRIYLSHNPDTIADAASKKEALAALVEKRTKTAEPKAEDFALEDSPA